MDVPFGSTGEQQPGRSIDWMPLMIVIGAVYLITTALVYASAGYYGGTDDYRIEYSIMLILSFLAATVFIATIACVVFRRVDQAKRLLITGMLIVIVILVTRTEVGLRSLW
jgi:ABC-type transport system involved in multi-copper enzyme maturation permease subunit